MKTISFKNSLQYFCVLCVLFIFVSPLCLSAQQKKQEEGWKNTWQVGFNGSQATYSNWSQGGVNSVSGSASSVYNANYKKEKFGYKFSNNLKYGQIKNDGQGRRKTDDQVILNNKFTYSLKNDISLVGNLNFQTQFTDGYKYDDDNNETRISDFFAPAYINQNVGLSYSPIENLSIELGVGTKHTIVSDTALSTNYGVDAGEKYRFEGGLNSGISFKKDIMENLTYTTSFESFTNFNQPVNETDITFRNEFAGKINKYLTTVFQFTMAYDRDFDSKIQIKQVLSVGISVAIL